MSISDLDLCAREVGDGYPVIVLHGGPDFDHTYLLPEPADMVHGAVRALFNGDRSATRIQSQGRTRPNCTSSP